MRSAGHARPQWDPWLLGGALALMLLGVIMVHSASVAYAQRVTGNSIYYLTRHLGHVLLGLLLLGAVMHTRVRWWEKAGPYLLLLGIGLLVAVLLPGIGGHVNGSSRWIRLGIVNLQPSEFVKLFMVVYVAGYLVRKQEELRNFTQGILMVSVVVAVVGMLLLQEPDLGTVVVICLAVLVMLFLGGVRFWHFLLVVAAGIGGMVLLTLIAPYRLERVTSFLDPWADPFGGGFQLTQALIAFGRGAWLGVGLGGSVQKLAYLPAAHTDFVLAVAAEELGLVVVLAVIALFGIIVVRAFAIARRAEAAGMIYGARLAQGLGLLIGMQAMINMGVNMGALPTKGLTLPFVSYGGSSLLASCVALALLLRVEREARARAWGRS
ncbi:MAG: cell division protein FtsW [Candidatus Muproteobacteria bacterium RIFCSPHIGHO2_02_FULL_65_16]|uniref:Probable peptidoglycan glycosyltransferase FtsW n=1 Tax=Candidatus Muproteobacteria bacterium RIFCSPHIGHO2_02_FULL_65_16 TaxID=1817766 RepID=A0A1F6U6A2_9PROT|nr:MAG: cell division protein FtsW [Candidatus Muproteobacteria bacterium RIFCSPHIGHO2_02_FULL_65_16]